MKTIIEVFDRLFRRHKPASQDAETFPQFENDNRELIKELTERESIPEKEKEKSEDK